MSRSIWPKASVATVARSLAAHSGLGLALGGLLYILAVTGTLSVFNREFQRWEQPLAPEMTAISPEAAARAAEAVFRSEPEPTTHLYINFPQPDLPRTVITTDTQAIFAAPDGSVAAREHFPWTEFLLDLHYYLHLPHTFGITLVGALGALLVALSLSGLLAHPRIFRDAFTFRRGGGRLTLADLHNRLSVWTLPFHLSNALTGAFLGLATVLAFLIAWASFEGDTEAVFSPIFGSEAEMDASPAPIADMQAALTYMQEHHPARPPTFLILHDPATAGQYISVIGAHTDRLIFGEYYNFNAAGAFEGTTGMADGTLGQQIAGSVYNVHFGNWGGPAVKLAYFVFGLALSAIIASGLNIYFARQRERGRVHARSEAAWAALVWTTPAALSAALLASVLGLAEGLGLVALFWTLLAAALLAGAVSADARRSARAARSAAAILLGLTVAVHAARHPEALLSPALLQVSLPLLAAAAAFALSIWRPARGPVTDPPVPAG